MLAPSWPPPWPPRPPQPPAPPDHPPAPPTFRVVPQNICPGRPLAAEAEAAGVRGRHQLSVPAVRAVARRAIPAPSAERGPIVAGGQRLVAAGHDVIGARVRPEPAMGPCRRRQARRITRRAVAAPRPVAREEEAGGDLHVRSGQRDGRDGGAARFRGRCRPRFHVENPGHSLALEGQRHFVRLGRDPRLAPGAAVGPPDLAGEAAPDSDVPGDAHGFGVGLATSKDPAGGPPLRKTLCLHRAIPCRRPSPESVRSSTRRGNDPRCQAGARGPERCDR
jgi:hypothetical protein